MLIQNEIILSCKRKQDILIALLFLKRLLRFPEVAQIRQLHKSFRVYPQFKQLLKETTKYDYHKIWSIGGLAISTNKNYAPFFKKGNYSALIVFQQQAIGKSFRLVLKKKNRLVLILKTLLLRLFQSPNS